MGKKIGESAIKTSIAAVLCSTVPIQTRPQRLGGCRPSCKAGFDSEGHGFERETIERTFELNIMTQIAVASQQFPEIPRNDAMV